MSCIGTEPYANRRGSGPPGARARFGLNGSLPAPSPPGRGRVIRPPTGVAPGRPPWLGSPRTRVRAPGTYCSAVSTGGSRQVAAETAAELPCEARMGVSCSAAAPTRLGGRGRVWRGRRDALRGRNHGGALCPTSAKLLGKANGPKGDDEPAVQGGASITTQGDKGRDAIARCGVFIVGIDEHPLVPCDETAQSGSRIGCTRGKKDTSDDHAPRSKCSNSLRYWGTMARDG
jgi:hypothetical protein